MAKYRRDEAVTATFHCLVRYKTQEAGPPLTTPFVYQEFDELCGSIASLPPPDLGDKEQFTKVKFGQLVPFFELQRIDNRTLFGIFEGAYSGHSFRNSEKGTISADSINQRRFHFILYLSEGDIIFDKPNGNGY